MLHKIFLSVILASSLGCMKLKKKTEEPNQSPVVVENSSKSVDQLDFDYDNEDGIQSVVFQIPNHWPQQIVIEKTVGNEKAVQREISIRKQTWKDNLDSSTKVTYKFYEKNSTGSRLIEQVDVLPVMDLSVTQDMSIESLVGSVQFLKKLKIRNLEIKNSAKFYLSNFQGKILIENLYSEKGIIQTFPEGTRAKEGNGRSVGNFDLEITSGEGELSLNLFGEAGANGKPGADPDESMKGTPGLEGEPAQFNLVPANNCIGSGTDMCIPGDLYTCSQQPKQGKDGQDGKRGHTGEQGYSGGSVYKINLANQSSALQIKILKRAGQKGFGGSGGVGGKPGEPGLGGDGGKRDLYRFLKIDPNDPMAIAKLGFSGIGKACEPAPAGRWGDRGPQGEKGPDGEDGIIY